MYLLERTIRAWGLDGPIPRPETGSVLK